MTDLEFEGTEPLGGDDATQQRTSAPYMSYAGYKNYLAKFSEPGGLPARFDKSYFGNVSGSLIAQVRASLKNLDLIDDEHHPTDLLKDLILAEGDEQQQYQRMIFEEKYADALALSKNATSGQLADVFRARGLNGATIQKAISFFLSMADDVGAEVSPHFKKGRAAASNGTAKKRVAKKATVPMDPPPPPAPAVSSEEAQKAKYVEMLMNLASTGDSGVQTELLDRIERALGIGGVATTKNTASDDDGRSD